MLFFIIQLTLDDLQVGLLAIADAYFQLLVLVNLYDVSTVAY